MTYESLLKLEKIVRDMGWISELVQEKVDEMRGLVELEREKNGFKKDKKNLNLLYI